MAPFTGSRLNVDIDFDNPVHYFKLFFNDPFFRLLVMQTNLYATQFLANDELKENSRMQKCSDRWRNESVFLTGDGRGREVGYRYVLVM